MQKLHNFASAVVAQNPSSISSEIFFRFADHAFSKSHSATIFARCNDLQSDRGNISPYGISLRRHRDCIAIQRLLNLIQWILRRRTGSMGNDRDLNRTRRRLMKAALTEFAAKGFAGARTDAIARTPGVDDPLIYYCFETKEGLYREVLRSKLAEEAHIVDSNEGDDFATALVKGYESCSSDTQHVRMWLWDALDAGRRKIAAEEERRALFEREKAQIRRAQRSGHLTADIDDDLLLLVRIGLLAAPTTLPQVTRLLTGMDPEDPKFRRRWSKCLRAIAARIAEPTRHGQRKASELHEHGAVVVH